MAGFRTVYGPSGDYKTSEGYVYINAGQWGTFSEAVAEELSKQGFSYTPPEPVVPAKPADATSKLEEKRLADEAKRLADEAARKAAPTT